MISKYGRGVVWTALAIAVLGSAGSLVLMEWKPLKYGLVVALLLALVFILTFFRDPERRAPDGEGLVLAPADGRIIDVSTVCDAEYLKSDAVRVSIFMSPLNVHVNRYPMDGTVEYFRYIPGDYLVAYHAKSSERNERTHIGLAGDRGKVLFKQIAGFIARRIVAEVRVGDRANAGARFGMIRFGSRVDVLVPATSELRVKTGDRSVAGETILAVLA